MDLIYEYIYCHMKQHKKYTYITFQTGPMEQAALQRLKQDVNQKIINEKRKVDKNKIFKLGKTLRKMTNHTTKNRIITEIITRIENEIEKNNNEENYADLIHAISSLRTSDSVDKLMNAIELKYNKQGKNVSSLSTNNVTKLTDIFRDEVDRITDRVTNNNILDSIMNPNYELTNNDNFEFHTISIPDYTPPTSDNLLKLWDILKEKDHENSVIMHCTAGYGRTGTMILSYIWFKKAKDITNYENVFNKGHFTRFIENYLFTYVQIINCSPLLEAIPLIEAIAGGTYDTYKIGKNIDKNIDETIQDESSSISSSYQDYKSYVKLLYYLMFQMAQYSYNSYDEIFLDKYEQSLLQNRLLIINDTLLDNPW